MSRGSLLAFLFLGLGAPAFAATLPWPLQSFDASADRCERWLLRSSLRDAAPSGPFVSIFSLLNVSARRGEQRQRFERLVLGHLKERPLRLVFFSDVEGQAELASASRSTTLFVHRQVETASPVTYEAHGALLLSAAHERYRIVQSLAGTGDEIVDWMPMLDGVPRLVLVDDQESWTLPRAQIKESLRLHCGERTGFISESQAPRTPLEALLLTRVADARYLGWLIRQSCEERNGITPRFGQTAVLEDTQGLPGTELLARDKRRLESLLRSYNAESAVHLPSPRKLKLYIDLRLASPEMMVSLLLEFPRLKWVLAVP